MSNAPSHESHPPQPTTTTIDGGTDFSNVMPGDLVVRHSGTSGRSILLPAGMVLTADHEPLDSAPDGAVKRLDGNYVTKSGGRVLDVSVSNEDLRK